MKSTLAGGLSHETRVVVDTARTIAFLGEELRVYSTPSLLDDFETACRDLLLQHTDPGEDSVGVNVNLTHGAPTLRGMTVSMTVSIARIEGRLVWFDLVARDEVEEVCRGSHSRFVVEVEKLRGKVAAKAAKAGKS